MVQLVGRGECLRAVQGTLPPQLTSFFKNYFLTPHLRMCLLILDRKEGTERRRNVDVREKHWSPTICAPTGDRTHNLGLGPHRELNLQPGGVWDDAPTKPPGQSSKLTSYWAFQQST